ncbi:hypothetical protein B0H66DRAFT_469394 [Apodospora peruviana]|uniref:Uncharacterized protein n=1 Tax=Apodospora peruviana TaxID=516989 RepID=A0AAE0MGE0_9PEZI|nr:hypothetical protein B0H66DRAFT_469394 [Apodospora peruviana]
MNSTSSSSPSPRTATTTTSTTRSHNFTGFAKELKDFSKLLTVETIPITRGGPQPTEPWKTLKRTDNKTFLPGQPRIAVKDDAGSDKKLLEYLQKCHLTKELDDLMPFMRFIFVQTPSFRHITPLHHQESRERKIIVDEHPGLHLVWYYERIFVKPIPAYFYSPAFWDYIKTADEDLLKAARGFMRTYYFLIQYPTDYALACKIGLIPRIQEPGAPVDPKEPEGRLPTYEEYCAFIEPFQHSTDHDVNRRFHYGEVRLTRINRTALVFRLHLAYFHIYPQWGSYLAHFLAPIITTFAVSTVVLNSMQVSLAALDIGPDYPKNRGWPSFVDVSLYFPIAVIVLIASVVALGITGILIMGIKDMQWANKTRRAKRTDPNAGEKSSGLIW